MKLLTCLCSWWRCAAVLLVCFTVQATSAADAADASPEMPLSLIPAPLKLERLDGQVALSKAAVIVASSAQERQLADYFNGLLRQYGMPALRVSGHAGKAVAISWQAAASSQATAGAYTLDVDGGGVRIRANDAAGRFYGLVTLWQLLSSTEHWGQMTLPYLHIEDAPRFAWRGLMLDSARHFQNVAEVEKLLDQMALHKLNVLHWHLTDDQGWRIEIKRYPELTRLGAWRIPPGAGEDGEPARYGGYYTQEQIRAVVAYAAARQITVMPELDLPGHAQAAVAAYPALGVTGARPAVSVDWGVNPYLYNVDPATFVFLHHVLDEVMALFPSRYIDLGGDEAIKDQWQASSQVQAKLRELGLHDENALQGWMMGQLGDYLAAHGRHLVGWDEILEGGAVPADATVMSWRGIKGAVEAARKGHDVVLSPSPDLYFDQLQSSRPDELSGRMPVRDLASVYGFDPIPGELDAAQVHHVLGVQGNAWTEHLPDDAHLEHAIFPRLDALSELAWSSAPRRNWQDFVARLPAQLARYRRGGIAYADSAFAPDVQFDREAALATGKAEVKLANAVQSGILRFTLDGSIPDQHAPVYEQPLSLAMPVTLRVGVFDAYGRPLAAIRDQRLDRNELLSRDSAELAGCSGHFFLRLQPSPDAVSLTPAYNVSVSDACRRYQAAPLDGIAAIRVEAARLPRNFALAHEQHLVKAYAAHTANGELEVRQDRSDGPLLASLPLPAPGRDNRRFVLDGRLPARQGKHDLYLIYTVPINGPLYAIGRVSLRSATP